MIPSLDSRGEQRRDESGKPIWIPTEADKRLAKHSKTLGFHVGGRWFPLYAYIEAYGRINSREGGIIPFEMNESQIRLYQSIAEMKEQGLPMRINDGKSRQMGGSTLISCMFFALCAFNPGKSVGIVADTEEHGMGLLEKYKLMWETTPDFLKSKITCEVDNAKELTLSYGKGVKSTFKVVVQGEKAGRSAHYNYLHESEVALWQSVMATIGALDATVSDADMDSIIVRETTAMGVNAWKVVFDLGMAGKGTYRSVFMPWYLEPSYKARWVEHDLTDFERNLFENGLSKEQVQWWRNKWENYGCDFVTMGKEYPTTPREMFLSTGCSFFNMTLVGKRKDELQSMGGKRRSVLFSYRFETSRDGNAWTISSMKAVEVRGAATTIFEEPKRGHPYILSVDPAKGGRDYWAAHVIDNSNFKQVATFHKEGQKIDGDDACRQLYCLLMYYKNGAFDSDGEVKEPMDNATLFTFENNLGSSLGVDFYRLGVRDIFVDVSKNTLSERASDQYGWRTGTDNRLQMLEMLKETFRDNPDIISDYETICEFEDFQFQQSGIRGEEKPMASQGKHDDLIMSLAGACYCRSALTTMVESNCTKRVQKGYDPFDTGRTRQSEHFMDW